MCAWWRVTCFSFSLIPYPLVFFICSRAKLYWHNLSNRFKVIWFIPFIFNREKTIIVTSIVSYQLKFNRNFPYFRIVLENFILGSSNNNQTNLVSLYYSKRQPFQFIHLFPRKMQLHYLFVLKSHLYGQNNCTNSNFWICKRRRLKISQWISIYYSCHGSCILLWNDHLQDKWPENMLGKKTKKTENQNIISI